MREFFTTVTIINTNHKIPFVVSAENYTDALQKTIEHCKAEGYSIKAVDCVDLFEDIQKIK